MKLYNVTTGKPQKKALKTYFTAPNNYFVDHKMMTVLYSNTEFISV